MSLSASIYIGIADGTSHGMGIAVLVQKKKDRPGKTLPRVRSVCPTHVHNTCPRMQVCLTRRWPGHGGGPSILAMCFWIFWGFIFRSIWDLFLDLFSIHFWIYIWILRLALLALDCRWAKPAHMRVPRCTHARTCAYTRAPAHLAVQVRDAHQVDGAHHCALHCGARLLSTPDMDGHGVRT